MECAKYTAARCHIDRACVEVSCDRHPPSSPPPVPYDVGIDSVRGTGYGTSAVYGLRSSSLLSVIAIRESRGASLYFRAATRADQGLQNNNIVHITYA
jgi:hypothetical protein